MIRLAWPQIQKIALTLWPAKSINSVTKIVCKKNSKFFCLLEVLKLRLSIENITRTFSSTIVLSLIFQNMTFSVRLSAPFCVHHLLVFDLN